jgi:hypothetical protein
MIESFIHKHETNQINADLKDKFYSSIKDYDFIDDNNNPRTNNENDTRTMAKIKLRQDKTNKYLVRMNNIKQLYNPTVSLPENQKNVLLRQEGGDVIQFKEVSKSSFDMYITFLRTMNPMWIRNAEREGF